MKTKKNGLKNWRLPAFKTATVPVQIGTFLKVLGVESFYIILFLVWSSIDIGLKLYPGVFMLIPKTQL
jgi:hypothetical protein